jgi:hypothetical protein
MYQYACEIRADVVIISEPNNQQAHWFNDNKGDASIWVTRFNGAHPNDITLIRDDGLVGIMIDDWFCVSRYCLPNLNKEDFSAHINRMDKFISNITNPNLTPQKQ